MTTEELAKIDKEIEEYRKNNINKSVNKDLVKRMLDVKIDEFNIQENNYALELYEDYLYKLNDLDKTQLKRYLTVLKNADLKDNQNLEKEDSFLLSLYLQSERKHAIDVALNASELNEEDLLKIHGILLKGTSSSELDNYSYRKNNRKFVGSWENGKKIIQYLPLDFKEIEEAMKPFFQYYNESDNCKQNIFFKSFLIHGIIAALQVFDDGNTRLARLLQNTNIYKQTKDLIDNNLNSPALYVTRAYYPQRNEYRSLIRNMAIEPNNENINNWIKFNLRRTEDTLYCNNEKVEKVKLLKK